MPTKKRKPEVPAPLAYSIENDMNHKLTLNTARLGVLLEQAAQRGAEIAIADMVCYHYKDACKWLGISYNTLQKRILEGKIHPVDGRITGAELRRYLIEHGRKR